MKGGGFECSTSKIQYYALPTNKPKLLIGFTAPTPPQKQGQMYKKWQHTIKILMEDQYILLRQLKKDRQIDRLIG